MSTSGDGGSRVSIPADLRKTIQNIREITGKQHSDEDIFSVFKECFNDPHETTQKLLFLDTFHEVRSKRERKKEISVPNTQGRGKVGGRNFASSYTDAGNGRSAAFKRQSGTKHIVGGSRNALPAPKINGSVPHTIKVSGPNHKTEDVFISPLKKEVTQEQPLSHSTSSLEDGVELVKSKASSIPAHVPVSESLVQNNTQCFVDGASQISWPMVNNQLAELQSDTFTKQDFMLVATSNCSSQSDQATKSEATAYKGKNQSLLEPDVGERSHVTFPVHLQVAKMLENGLTFGSFDSNSVKEASSENGTIGYNDSSIKSSHGMVTNWGNHSPRSAHITNGASAREDVVTFSQDKDHEISHSAPETVLGLQSDQTSYSEEGSKGDDLKEESFLSTAQPSLSAASQPAANSESHSISYPDQCSIAASQHAIHHYRQQYPPSFFPYGPYFPPYYLPQPYIQQFMSPNPNGLQQQSCLPPRDGPAPPGVKVPLPHFKTGSNIENPTLTTIPSPYNSYASSAAAFNHIGSAAAINSTHKEEKKEKVYITGALTESPSAWMSEQSLANLQVSTMYNFALQGQPLAFPTVQAGFTGMYQQTHPMLASPVMNQTLQPLHATADISEPVGGLPPIIYQQHQAALTNRGDNY